MSAQTHSSAPSPSPVKDVALWRRRSLTATILIAATATWMLLQVYQFHFATLFSWLAMFLVASSFLWANTLRLFGKAPLTLSDLELTEESALQMAYVARAWIEEGIRLLFRVSSQEDWSLFLGAVAGLMLLSYVASKMDLLTVLYIGTLASTTVPVIYNNNQSRIKSSVEWLRVKSKRAYDIFDERAIQKIKRRVINENEMKRANEKKAR
ncbi:reticulon-like protein B13 isoform X2 [Prosopis cineraria]|uniref:reticulon-like protein B13 isoform X2 n=1 Tax=Prosopis cineraria TaxID=364024 RepID=UPI00240ED35B|nr:reticulon-like protein B13 isoform X2 [Prosopis cineraria]